MRSSYLTEIINNRKPKEVCAITYKEVSGGNEPGHPAIKCKDERPFFLMVSDHCNYYACNTCSNTWVERNRGRKAIGVPDSSGEDSTERSI